MLLMLTGMRKNECANLPQTWIQQSPTVPELCTLKILSTITKNKKELLLPLGDLSVAIVRSAVAAFRSEKLFSTPGATIFSAWSKWTVT
jgi:site-specific recombinase XerD